MFEIKKSLSVTVILAAAVALGACGSPVDEAQDPDPTSEPPPMPVFSADGVTLDTNAPDHAAGRFERHDTTVVFEIDRSGDRRHVFLTTASGRPLFESVLESGIDHATYLGGKLEMAGRIDEEPARTGDVAALDELSAMPEAKAMIELKTALEAAGVSEQLLRVAEPSSKITPKVYGAGGSTPYPDNRWYFLRSFERIGFYSWGFWATTVVVLQGVDGGGYGAQFRVGASFASELVSGFGQGSYYRMWWGQYVDVTNIRVQLCAGPNFAYCDNPAVWVLVR